MKQIWARFLFTIKYKTWKRVSPCQTSLAHLAVCHGGKEIKIKRQCPHRGLPLDKGYFQGDDFVCPWHGCRLSLSTSSLVRPYVPTLPLHTRP